MRCACIFPVCCASLLVSMKMLFSSKKKIYGESTYIWATTFSIAPKFSMKLQTYHNKLKNERGHKSKSVIRDKAVCPA